MSNRNSFQFKDSLNPMVFSSLAIMSCKTHYCPHIHFSLFFVFGISAVSSIYYSKILSNQQLSLIRKNKLHQEFERLNLKTNIEFIEVANIMNDFLLKLCVNSTEAFDFANFYQYLLSKQYET